MPKIFALVVAFVLCLSGLSRAAFVSDLAGPSDYGGATQPAKYDLASLTVGDTRQGQVADCWWVATLASIIHQRPGSLSRNYAVNADGTVNVTYFKSGVPYTYQVTSAVNTWWGDPYTSYDDSNGNAAAAIMQKAYAAYRSPLNTMADLNWGVPSEAIFAFGLTGGLTSNSVAGIASTWAQGDVVVIDTGAIVPADAVADHSYSVWSVNAAAGTAVIRSAWGDGYAGFDEFITVNDAWLKSYSVGVFYGQFGGAAPAPEPASLATLGIGAALLMRRKLLRG